MIVTKRSHCYSFGYGVHGQLGLNNSENQSAPRQVNFQTKSIVENPLFEGLAQVTSRAKIEDVALGQNHSLALVKDQ